MIFWSGYYNTLSILKELRYFYCLHKSGDGPKICNEKDLLMLQAISGGTAGIIAAICTNPLDMLRLRVQV